jgi:hypothetical protein
MHKRLFAEYLFSNKCTNKIISRIVGVMDYSRLHLNISKILYVFIVKKKSVGIIKYAYSSKAAQFQFLNIILYLYGYNITKR